MRTALFSSSRFGRRCLEEAILKTAVVELVGILTTSEEVKLGPHRRTMALTSPARYEELSDSLNCPLEIRDTRLSDDDYRRLLAEWKPDLVLVLGWYQVIPALILPLAPLGFVGIHASLLPRYRGMAPVNWVIINGESETGISMFYLADGVDNGDIISQTRIPISEADTCATLYDKVTAEAIITLREQLPLIAAGRAARIAQDNSLATVMPRRRPEDGLIDWTEPAKKIYDFVRAQTRPYPGAFTYVEGQKLTVWSCSPLEESALEAREPGSIRRIKERLFVHCGSGAVELREVGWGYELKSSAVSADSLVGKVCQSEP